MEWIRRSLAYESCRWMLRQVVKEKHYPAPVWERILYSPIGALEKHAVAAGRKSIAGLRLPTFLGIGSMKCGTTWLLYQLGAHPDIAIYKDKEAHYFSWHWHRSLEYYSSMFPAHPARVVGEFSVEYMFLPDSRIRWLRRVMPELRLLFLMRNPIDRAWSHAKQELVFRTHRPYEQVRPFEFYRRFRMPITLEHGNYVKYIDRWLRHFPESQLWVGFYDDIVARPTEVIRSALDHVGLPDPIDIERFPYRRKYIEGVNAPPMPAAYREFLAGQYAGVIRAVARRYGGSACRWLDDLGPVTA